MVEFQIPMLSMREECVIFVADVPHASILWALSQSPLNDEQSAYYCAVDFSDGKINAREI